MFRAIRVGNMSFSRCPYLGRIVVDAEPFHPFNTCPYLVGIDHAMSECRHFEDIRFKGELNWKFSENGNFAYAHVRMQLSRIWVNSVSWWIYIYVRILMTPPLIGCWNSGTSATLGGEWSSKLSSWKNLAKNHTYVELSSMWSEFYYIAEIHV